MIVGEQRRARQETERPEELASGDGRHDVTAVLFVGMPMFLREVGSVAAGQQG
jgi:hypothetical protein